MTNILGPTAIPVETIEFQYWFDGPDLEESGASPDELFMAICTDTTPGLGDLCASPFRSPSPSLLHLRLLATNQWF